MLFHKLLLVLFVVFDETVTTIASKQCQYIIQDDFSNCTFEPGQQRESKSETNDECKNQALCTKTFIISGANYPPFSHGMGKMIEMMLSDCCGNCSGMSVVNISRESLQVTAESKNTSDILYPIFAKLSDTSSHTILHGFWFIPIFDVPSTYYVIQAQTSEQVLKEMLGGFYELWPFLCICLLLAVLAGFVVWVLETWKNKDEFPRSFFRGTFEGFWWSFVSMTTVGYGDKTPKSTAARIFSVVWILFGITICSILTASLTSILTAAQSTPSTDMTSKKVGALKGRVYDAAVIARHGGIIAEFDYDNITSGMSKLLEELLSGDINGFLVDRHTYLFVSNEGHLDSSLGKTIRSEKYITNEKLYYGMLVKNYDDYRYLHGYMMNNWFQVSTCISFASNDAVVKNSDRVRVFSPKGGVFIPCVLYMSIAVIIICCVGLVYEIVKRKRPTARASES